MTIPIIRPHCEIGCHARGGYGATIGSEAQGATGLEVIMSRAGTGRAPEPDGLAPPIDGFRRAPAGVRGGSGCAPRCCQVEPGQGSRGT